MLVDAKRVPAIPGIEPMVEPEVDMDMSITQTESHRFFCEEKKDKKDNEIAYFKT